MRAPIGCLLLLLVLVSAGCKPAVDLTKGLEVTIANTGWFDAGIVNGRNKLVPSITLTLTNKSDQKLNVLQLNALFKRVTENDEWGNSFMDLGSGLAPGASTAPLTIRSNLGYTGSDQSRQEMLKNAHFVDAKVQLFAKYGSTQWVRLGEYQVARELLTK